MKILELETLASDIINIVNNGTTKECLADYLELALTGDASISNWNKIKQDTANNEPIPYDDDDRAMGFHDPNNDEEVEEFFTKKSTYVVDVELDYCNNSHLVYKL